MIFTRCLYSKISAPTRSNLAKLPDKQILLERVKKEYEIFEYFSDRVPQTVTDDMWENTLLFSTVEDRVKYWEYVSKKQYMEKQDLIEKKENSEKLLKEIQEMVISIKTLI